MSNFKHDIIKSWLVAYPEKFLGILKDHNKTWVWLNPTEIRGKEETFSEGMMPTVEFHKGDLALGAKVKTTVFYDVVYAVVSHYRNAPNRPRPYYAYIEVKTGKYSDSWLEQLYRQRYLSSHIRIHRAIPDEKRIGMRFYLWIIPESEILNFDIGISGNELKNGWQRDLFAIPLEWFLPTVISDITSSFPGSFYSPIRRDDP